jgi:glutaconate CoA-transferase subunit B
VALKDLKTNKNYSLRLVREHKESGEMELAALYPGVTIDDMRGAIGWPLAVRRSLAPVDAPSAKELKLLRDVLDPQKRYLKGGAT